MFGDFCTFFEGGWGVGEGGDRAECTNLARARAGLSQKARAGLARLGSETRSKSELGSARARNDFEFPS